MRKGKVKFEVAEVQTITSRTQDCLAEKLASCSACPVRPVTILRNLAAKPLGELEMWVCHRTYRQGKALFTPNKPVQDLLIIRTGWVKVYFLNAAGKEQIVELVGPGGLVGETVVSGNNPGVQYAAALSNVQACALPAAKFRTFMQQYPELAEEFLRTLGEKLTRSRELTCILALEPAEQRLAKVIEKLLESKELSPKGWRLRLPVTVELLARLTGMTPETAARILGRWRRQGIIQREGRQLIIYQPEVLAQYANIDLDQRLQG